ncbi:MAG: TonB-dependent receptor, partial [Bacteroidaceae bacterium]|nr:TonB-dependent receptor [Bacteroidaceae bacterium]
VNYGLKAQLTQNCSYQTTWDASHTQLPDASSRTDYEERILNAYVGASGTIGPVGLEASVTAEQYHTAQWNRWRAFPAVSALWNVTPRHMLNLSYSAETFYPSY